MAGPGGPGGMKRDVEEPGDCGGTLTLRRMFPQQRSDIIKHKKKHKQTVVCITLERKTDVAVPFPPV